MIRGIDEILIRYPCFQYIFFLDVCSSFPSNPLKNNEVGQNKQQKPVKVSIFSLFYSKKGNILFLRAFLSFVILNAVSAFKSSQIFNGQKCNTAPRTFRGLFPLDSIYESLIFDQFLES